MLPTMLLIFFATFQTIAFVSCVSLTCYGGLSLFQVDTAVVEVAVGQVEEVVTGESII